LFSSAKLNKRTHQTIKIRIKKWQAKKVRGTK
jgi:hypothetical protein